MKRILIVDDDLITRELVKKVLERIEGVEIEEAWRGEIALKLAKENHFDLIIMDWGLPGINGFETAQELRKYQKTMNIPIILVTGFSSQDKMIEAFNLGFFDYLKKPFDEYEFLARIKSCLMISGYYSALDEKNKEIDEKNRELEKQKKIIGDSINYARKITDSLLPDIKRLGEYCSDYFVSYKPKDIIGGDFYWFTQRDGLTFICVADATGHGVPGALISMMGLTLLNQIVQSEGVIEPSEIVNSLDEKINFTFSKGKSEEIDIYDGMDITIIRIDTVKKEIKCSGANQSAFFLTDDSVREIQGDPYPVGGALSLRRKESYSQVSISYRTGDMIYMLSDGYIDQIGGMSNTKFMRQPFVDMLKELFTMGTSEQKALIEKRFDEWKSQYRQIDDVLIIGVRL